MRALTAEEIERFRHGNAAQSAQQGNMAAPLATLDQDGLVDVDLLSFPQQFQIAWRELEICEPPTAEKAPL